MSTVLPLVTPIIITLSEYIDVQQCYQILDVGLFCSLCRHLPFYSIFYNERGDNYSCDFFVDCVF